LLIVVALFLARPFLMLGRARRAYISERRQLETAKEALLLQIQHLDFDHDTGKIPTPIHERQRAVLVEEAAEVMKALDALKATIRSAKGSETEIEATIARIRGEALETAPQTAPQTAPHSHSMPAAVPTPAAPRNGPTAFCTQCGAQVARTDKFCANCGHALATETTAAGATAGNPT
jgi:hypothetical protein